MLIDTFYALKPLERYLLIKSSLPFVSNILYSLTIQLVDLDYLQQENNLLLLHCIGHSLGAHICGYHGRYLLNGKGIKPRRITGLDPAGVLFGDKLFEIITGEVDYLFYSDADLVDVIHTSHSLGLNKNIGTIDFYPNQETDKFFFNKNQPGCSNMDCNHGRAHQYFIASINNCKFEAKQCASYSDYIENKCYGYTSQMGLFAQSVLSPIIPYKFYLKTTGDETDPRFCGKPKTCFHVKSKKNGFCSNKGSYNCNKKQEDNKECNEKNSNKYKCCIKSSNTISKTDLSFVIDVTASTGLTNELFSKSLNFVSNLINRSDIQTNSTKVALSTYTNSNIKTHAYLDENNDSTKILNLIKSIKLETNVENSQSPISNIISECEKIYTLEKGMRDSSKGFGKQIIFITGDIITNNNEFILKTKKFKSQGITFYMKTVNYLG